MVGLASQIWTELGSASSTSLKQCLIKIYCIDHYFSRYALQLLQCSEICKYPWISTNNRDSSENYFSMTLCNDSNDWTWTHLAQRKSKQNVGDTIYTGFLDWRMALEASLGILSHFAPKSVTDRQTVKHHRLPLYIIYIDDVIIY